MAGRNRRPRREESGGADATEFEGVVIEALPNASFRVQVQHGSSTLVVLAHIAGKLRVNKIRVLPGDRVRVEVSIYDLTRGRIVYRMLPGSPAS